MFNRLYRTMFVSTPSNTAAPAAWVVFARDTISGFIITARHMATVLGITAIGALALMFVKPQIADQLKAVSPFAQQESDENIAAAEDEKVAAAAPAQAAAATQDVKASATAKQQQWVTHWLAKRYRVATDATDMLVSAAYQTAHEMKLDPLLILSVVAIESRFNPFAESPMGAQGLMQVMSKVHHDKFAELGGVKEALNPAANIRVGSKILKDYVTRGGSVEAGLKLYVGAGAMESDAGYGAKVLAEYRRLKDVAMGKKVPVYTTTATVAPAKPKPVEVKRPDEVETATGDAPAAAAADRVAAL